MSGSFAPGGSWRTRDQTTSISGVQGGVAQAFRGRGGDKHDHFSETPDLALVKAVIAHAVRWAECGDTVVAVFHYPRAYLYAEEERETRLLTFQITCLQSSVRRTWEKAA